MTDDSFWIDNLIYKVISGSQSYGIDTPESDLDVRGICIPPKKYLIGLSRFDQWTCQSGDEDTVIYALEKFVNLALACNPNIIELLYVNEQHVLYINDHGQRLIDSRDSFLSKKARWTFGGYAISQLKKIERHHRWLSNPPGHQPTQDEFGGYAVDGHFKFPDQHKQHAYRSALKHWNQYQEWIRNRNPKRAELERKYGYDTKHAVHLIRLLKMGIEILETGNINVYRPDREWLREVRRGMFSYEELLDQSVKYEQWLDDAYEKSRIPEKPNFKIVEDLTISLQEQFLW